MKDMAHVNDSPAAASDSDAITAERRARVAAERAYMAARVAYASKVKEDILKAGDLYRYAAALYGKASDLWKARGSSRKSFAEHCAKMAERLSGSAFARCSLVATY